MVTTTFCNTLGLSANLCGMLYNIIFPWLITFAIVFGLLIKTKLFVGDDTKVGKGVSGMIALAIGFFVTAVWGVSMGQFFINTSGTIMMFLMVILGLLLIVGLTNKNFMPSALGSGWTGLGALIVIVVLAWALLGGWLGGGLSFYALFKQDAFALAIILAVIAAMWYFVTTSDVTEEKSS